MVARYYGGLEGEGEGENDDNGSMDDLEVAELDLEDQVRWVLYEHVLYVE